MTYITRVLCREVFYRWNGTLGNELPIGRGCLLLHDLGLHPGERCKDAGRNEGYLVTGGSQPGQPALAWTGLFPPHPGQVS
jgi:hypothetical protein